MICKPFQIIGIAVLLVFAPLIAQDSSSTDVEGAFSEDSEVGIAETSSASPKEAEAEKEEVDAVLPDAETAPEPLAEPVSTPRRTGLQLLDISDLRLYDARIPGLEIKESEQIIAELDEPELQSLANNSEETPKVAGDEVSEKGSDVSAGYHSMNKLVKLWFPRALIILLLIILIMLYNTKSKKRRRRVFRKIPSKRR
ncbi:MAG: hypothetical protein PF637_02865 [Spirochaetes bacterium]|nr:hypothetical protein [Spirochaetota bacterium]